jgi:hypothetical protein
MSLFGRSLTGCAAVAGLTPRLLKVTALLAVVIAGSAHRLYCAPQKESFSKILSVNR